MKKQITFFKTLLAAALLGVGANTWAETGDVTTNADIDFGNAITDGSVAGTVNSMTIGATTDFATEIAGDEGAKYLFLGDGINTVTIPEAQRAGKKDVITIQFDMAIADGSNNHAAFYIQDAEGANIGYMKCALWDAGSRNETNLGIALNTTTFNKNSKNPKDALWSKRTSFTITLDYLNNTITTVSQIQGGNLLDPIVVSMTNKNPVAKFVVQAWPSNGAGGAARRAKFGNLVIKTTEGNYTVATADYTVNWKVGDEIVKTDTRSGDVGSTISLLASDKETFFNEAGTKKYSYVSDDSSEKTIADGGTTVVTITCEEVGKFDYSVTTSVGSVIEQGTLYNDETKTISWSKYIEKDGTYYQATAPFQFTVTKDAPTKEISVTESQVTQFVETTSGNWAGTGVENANLSGGIAYRGVSAGGTKTMLTVSETGIYSINYAVFSTNTGTGKEFDFSLYKNDASVDANLIETFSVNHSVNNVLTTGTRTIKNVTLQAGDVIIAKSGNTTCALDYIALAKEAVSFTLGANEGVSYKSYVTKVATDFTANGLEAYVATGLKDSKVILTKIEKAPAGTPVILKGTKGQTTAIMFTADEVAAPAENLLKASTGTAISASESKYVLAFNDPNWEFCHFEGTLSAGKVYLDVPAASAKSLEIVFDGQTTGINDASRLNAETTKENIVFNLNGQRIAAPQKGINIINGRKVIVK